MITVSLSSLPVEEGARRLALAYLDAAGAARSRMDGSGDPEALHDYRVALRRLRSCLRAYRNDLRSTVSRKSLRRLRRLARGTNESRELEVHLSWLAGRRDAAGEAERPGVAWLIARLEEAQRRERKAMRALDQKVFPWLDERLRGQLVEYPTIVRLGGGSDRPPTAAVTASLVRRAAARLGKRLRRIRDISSEVEIHRARIAAKHLRYLLEPFAVDLPGGAAVIERLKAIQDAFGDVHDTQVLLAKLHDLPRKAAATGRAEMVSGLQDVMVALRRRGIQAFASAGDWLQEGAGGFFDQVDRLSGAIEEPFRPARSLAFARDDAWAARDDSLGRSG